jgi:hypothetical protein
MFETATAPDATNGLTEDPYNDDDATMTEAGDEWTPPTREEYEKLLASKAKVTEESIKRKKLLREHGIDLKTGKRAAASEHESDDISKADFERELGQVKSESKNQGLQLGIAVHNALTEAGWNGVPLDRVVRHLDLSSVAIDEDGVSGLTEQIEELKRDFPEFFKRTRSAAPAGAVGAGTKKVEPATRNWQDEIRDRFKRGEL